ncbi:MAG TPA: cell division regulator GpsB, partial [Pseudogracilibacillus sp.]|nr:cell division regulator GpsB [Pseudogracilibacillus sp.]
RYKKNMEQTSTRASQSTHQVNYDVLKRLSNLEKEVFGQKRSES